MEEEKTYFLTPNTKLYGQAALSELETELLLMDFVLGKDYFVFPTGDVSLKADTGTLEKLRELGVITGYEPEKQVEAIEVKAIDDIISREPA